MSSVTPMAAAKPEESIARLRGTELDLVALLSGLDTKRLRQRPTDGEWSALQILCHLADAEMVYGVRIRLILTVERPWISAYDQDAWADRFVEVEHDFKETVNRWRITRDANLRVLGSLQPQDWERAGMHAERGEESVAAIAGMLADHDRDHLAQLRRVLAAT